MVNQPAPSASFGSQVFMVNGSAPVSIATRLKDYAGSCQAAVKGIVDGPPPPPSFGPLNIERPSVETRCTATIFL